MKQNKMYSIIKEPKKDAQICLIEKGLKGFNAIVEGRREVIPFPQFEQICIIFDTNALANAKLPNCFLPEYNDLLLGTVIVSAIDLEKGFISLTEEQTEKLLQYLSQNDAKEFKGDVADRVKTEYLPNSDETSIYGFLSEAKSKYKTIKIKWLNKK